MTRTQWFGLLLFILCIYSCIEKKQIPRDSFLIEPIQHPTFFYLADGKNVHDTSYIDKALSYSDYFLKKNQIDSATIVLSTVSNHLFENYIEDSLFVHKVIQFTNQYQSQIPLYYWGKFYIFIADYFAIRNQLDSSIYYSNRGIITTDSSPHVIFNNAKINYYLLFTHLNNGSLDKALSSALTSLDLYTSIDSLDQLGPVHSGIACIQLFDNNYSEALYHEQIGYQLAQKVADSTFITACSFNKINLYHVINHPNLIPFIDSTSKFMKAWAPKSKNPFAKYEMAAWEAYREVYMGNLEEAKSILDKIKPTVIASNHPNLTDYYANALSLYELKTKKGANDPAFYTNKLKELEEYKDYSRLQLYYQILADDALLNQNYKQAYEYLIRAEISEDSLSNLIISDKLAQLDKSYKTSIKEKTIQVQSAELAKKQTYILMLGILLISFILIGLVYIFWQKQKSLQKERRTNFAFTKLLFQNVEDERKRIANDLHDSISHELLTLKNIHSEEKQQINHKIDTLIHEVRSISRNLHPVMFDKIGLIPNIHQLIERIQVSQQFMISSELEYSGGLVADDELQIYRIIQESLSNCIKYANAHAAKVSLKEVNNGLQLQIIDNGQGFDVDYALENKKSFGLHSIIERSRAIGGFATIQSSDKGTNIRILIPLIKS